MQRTAPILFMILTAVTTVIAGPTEDALRIGEEAVAKKDYTSAVTTWVNAYNERATADTANDETCAKLLSSAGDLLAKLNRFKESAICYENLLKLREKISGLKHPDAEKVKSLLAAQIANSGGDLDRSERLSRESLEALTQAGDAYLDDRLQALMNLAGILLLKKDRLGAHEFFAEVTLICEKNPAKSALPAIEAYGAMSSIAEFFGRAKDQLQYLRKASETSRKHHGEKHAATYLARLNVATALISSGNNAEAKTELLSIIDDLGKQGVGAGDSMLQQRWAAATYRLAILESGLKNADRAFELIKSSLEHARLGWSDLDANTLPLYLELAKGHISRKNYKEGVRSYQKVLDIRRRELGPDDSSTKETQNILNELLEDVRKAEAGR